MTAAHLQHQALHTPVLLREVVTALAPTDGGTYLDATFGNGGYTTAILEAAACAVIAIDRDPDAIARGAGLADTYNGRLTLHEGLFSEMQSIAGPDIGLDGIAFDLGVCSTQLDQPERGFSFRFNGPLDMRMAQAGEVGVLRCGAHGEQQEGSGPNNHGGAALLPLPRAAAVRGLPRKRTAAARRGVAPERVARKRR